MTNLAESRATGISSLRRFVPYLTEQSGRVAAAYSVSFLGVVFSLLLPWPLKFMIDTVLTGQGDLPLLAVFSGTQQLIVLAGSMAFLATLAAIVQAAEKVMHAKIRERFSYRLRDDLIRKVYRLSRESQQEEMSGELTMRLVSDTQLVSRLFCKTFPITARHVLTAAAALVSITLISLPIGFASFVMAALLATLVVTYGPRLALAAATKRRHEGRMSAHTQETINGIEHIQAMALENQARSRYLDNASASLRAGVDEIRTAVRLERSSQILAGASLALVAGIGGMAVVRGHLLLGELTVCLSYIAQLLKPIERINEIAQAISRGLARADRIHDLFDADVTPESPKGAIVAERIHRIECSNLGYRYRDSDHDVVAGFNHTFRVGECTSIVGPSGCGKSTLLRLILGLQSPTGGVMSINGRNYGDLNLGALRTQFAVLLQDAHLFAGSIRDIVSEANTSASDFAIQAALRDVDLLHVVDSLPSGLDTPIDEAGARFSVGQRARLLLARALLSERPVLLLDEPFANLDEDSRRVILQCLEEAKTDRILIVVTHEQALRGLADHVLTVHNFELDTKKQGTAAKTAAPGIMESGHATA